jgi:hypothetical protein
MTRRNSASSHDLACIAFRSRNAMYSTVIQDEEYEPLLVLYLTTTGALLQNHVRAQLIAGALREVVARMGKVPVEFDTLGLVRQSLESKANQAADLRKATVSAATLASSSTPTPSSVVTAVPLVGPTGATPTPKVGFVPPPPGPTGSAPPPLGTPKVTFAPPTKGGGSPPPGATTGSPPSGPPPGGKISANYLGRSPDPNFKHF